MGINQVPIVNQYADINRRLAEIQQRPESLSLPEGIWIISSTAIDDSQEGIYFALRGDMILLVRTRNWSGETLRSDRGRAFISYLRGHFPDLRHNGEDEIWLGNEMPRLKRGLGLT
jgi:hypothetical protein